MIEPLELFVIAPFGKRPTALPDLPILDFDHVFDSVIDVVATDHGWRASRGDRLFASGVVMDAVVSALYRAQLVIADVTLPNANVFYELGIRHSIAAGGTLLIAHEGAPFPFDLAHHRVLRYDLQHLDAFRSQLARALQQHASFEAEQDPTGVRAVLERLEVVTGSGDARRFEQDAGARLERAENVRQLIAVWQWARQHNRLPSRLLGELARKLHRFKEWKVAAEVLERAIRDFPDDFELRRTFGWTLRKLGRAEEAEAQLKAALLLNAGDPEAWGMLGGLLKEQNRLEEAAAAYKTSLRSAPDEEYALVNLACIELLLGGEARTAGIERYRLILERSQARSMTERDVWADLNEAEACFVLGQDARARGLYIAIASRPGITWEVETALQQLLKFARAGFRAEEAPRLVEQVIASQVAAQLASEPVEPAQAIAKAFASEATFSPIVALAPPSTPVAAPEATRPPAFLHLSDLHFGTRPGKDGARDPMHRFLKSDSSKSLLEHLVDQLASFSFEPGQLHLVVSGDITYTATADEFSEALQFLESFVTAFKLDKRQVALAPGNHDVSWPAAVYEAGRRFDRYLVFLRKFYGKELAKELYPKIDWSLDPENAVNGSDLFAVHTLAGGSVELVSLNSCVHENESHHWGFVGEPQLEKVGRALRPVVEAAKPPVRIAVMHHHLHVFPESHDARAKEPWLDVSIVRDAGAVERWIEEQQFSLLMHGHKHKPQLRETMIRGFRQNRDEDGRPLIVCGAGSASVHPRELEANFGNHFEVIELLRAPRAPGADFVRVTWRELPTDSTVFWNKRPAWVLKG